MKIGMIHIAYAGYPPDVRIDKELKALSNAGFTVSVFTHSPTGSVEIDKETRPGATIYRYPVRRPSILRKVYKYFSMKSPEWRTPLLDYIEKERPHAVHIHDLPYLPTVVDALKENGFMGKIVADLHENMPAAKVAYKSGKRFLDRVARTMLFEYRRWQTSERKYVSLCDRVITVVPEAQARLLEYGIGPDRLTVVSNTEDESTFPFNAKDLDQEIVERYKNRFMITYIGGISPHRGLDTVMQGVAHLKSRIPEILFTIVGASRKKASMLMEMVHLEKLENHVEIIDWQPFEKIYSYMVASSVCLVPHKSFEHTETTIPHKLFQYMISGCSVLVSDCKPLKRVVGDNDVGFVFRAGDPVAFSEKVEEIYHNREEAQRRAANGRQLALSTMSWQHDAARLVQMYNDEFSIQHDDSRK